jgi:hypothetical protein
MLAGAGFGALIALLYSIVASTIDQTYHDFKTMAMATKR